MDQDDLEQRITYLVVVNHEEQYSIWPDYKTVPNGWRAVGKSGTKKECLDYIGEVWTDMRPLSVRRHMEAAAAPESNTPMSEPAGALSAPDHKLQ
jgi:MbtH protein